MHFSLDVFLIHAYSKRNMAKLSEQQARKLLRRSIEDAGGVRAYARRIGVSAAYVSDANRGRRDIAGAIAGDLGLVKQVRIIISYLEA